jgi:hypothetical protein
MVGERGGIMQIVIDIPEQLIELAQKELIMGGDMPTIANAISNGVVLPNGHGRLVDADALEKKMCDREIEVGDDEAIWESSAVSVALDMFAPTIIEADKGE